MKPKSKILSLLLAICLVVGLMPTVAFAATDTGKAIQLVDSGTAANIDGYDSTNGYDYIYYGTWNDSAIKWRVLDDQTNTGENGLFLLSEELLGTYLVFDKTSPYPSKNWQGSDAQVWCKDFAGIEGSSVADAFSTDECNAILETTKSDEAFTSSSSVLDFAASENILNEDKVFFLSAEEAENSEYGFTDDDARIANYNGKSTGWWLRSPRTPDLYNVGSVTKNGKMSSNYASNSNYPGRPAFNLDLNTVLFTSAANGGKPEGGLQAISDYEGDEWKLTLLDSNRQFVVTETDASGKPGDTISLNYTGAITGQDEYISVLLTDQQGNALYYGRVAQPDNESGTVDVTIPTDLVDGTYTLNVFSEQYNGDYKTDYASAFEAVTLTVSSDTTAPALSGGSATRDSETAATVKFTSDEAGSYYYEVVESGATAPTIDTTGTGTSCDTTEQTISLDNLSGTGAKDIYIVAKDAAGNVSNTLKITIPVYIAPSYGISASPAALNFGSKTVDYTEAPAAQTVTLTNTGNQDITVTLPTSTNYIITAGEGFANDTATLAPNGTVSFTVQPNTGLAAGDYSETLTISGSNSTSASVGLSFEVLDTYTLTVNLNGGSGSTNGGEYPAGKVINIDAGSRSNYRFNGWTSSNGGTFADASSASTTFTMPANDTTITANWKKKSSGGSVFFWDLRFDTNGGSDINTVTEWEYSTIDLDEYVPEKEGYKFAGWYADKDLDKKIDEVYLTQDTTVYAKWEKIAEEVPEESEEVEEIEETETISFLDVKENDWFYEAVSYAVENGLMSGMSEDIFAPNTPLTREMLAVVLYNVEGQPESTGVNPFTDVKADMWYTDAILWANENGIVAGYDNGAYGVGDLITREQFAAILYRYAQFKGYDVSVGADTNILSYADALDISEYAYPAMQWACGADIMGGMDDGTLMPQGKATRAEAATMLMNFCENVVKK